jgi:1,4-alpha-glucan branching enzyme
VRHARWTSAATHAVLPLLASDAGVRVQAHAGVLAHRERVGEHWDGGFWLPECAYAPWLGRTLHDAGVRRSCVELTSLYGLGAREHLQPLLTGDGIVLFPIDRSTISLVWSDDGYPAGGVYRDYHHHTIHHHNPWSNDGEAYDHDRAVAAAGAHARDFVARVRARLDDAAASGPALPGGGLVVCALDTELLGHWWYEGVDWLVAVVEECARQGVELVHVDEAPGASEPRATPAADSWMPSSWGEGGRLATWSGPAVAELAFATRAAELDVLGDSSVAGPAALRELLALQASDWAFMISRGIAAPYARERFDGHLARVREALAAGPDAPSTGLRNLARHAEHVSLSAL